MIFNDIQIQEQVHSQSAGQTNTGHTGTTQDASCLSIRLLGDVIDEKLGEEYVYDNDSENKLWLE